LGKYKDGSGGGEGLQCEGGVLLGTRSVFLGTGGRQGGGKLGRGGEVICLELNEMNFGLEIGLQKKQGRGVVYQGRLTYPGKEGSGTHQNKGEYRIFNC